MVSPDPCSPMMCSASVITHVALHTSHLTTQTSHCPTARHSPQPSRANRSKHMLSLFSAEMLGPKPNQLTVDPRHFHQKEEKTARHAARTSLGRSTAKKLCVDAHCPMHPEKARGPLPKKACRTDLGSDLNPSSRRSLQPRFHKSLDPTASILIFHALEGCIQRHYILEVLLPQLKPRFMSRSVVEPDHKKILCLWLPSWPTKPLLFGSPAASLLPLPHSS